MLSIVYWPEALVSRQTSIIKLGLQHSARARGVYVADVFVGVSLCVLWRDIACELVYSSAAAGNCGGPRRSVCDIVISTVRVVDSGRRLRRTVTPLNCTELSSRVSWNILFALGVV